MLNRYLHRLYDTILSRGYVEVERLVIENRSGQSGAISGALKFYDGSLLEFGQVFLVQTQAIKVLRYRLHYQDASGTVVFRYDNAPHYPSIETHPHHKHVGSEVLPSSPPDLSDVLREIDSMIFDSE